MKLNKSRYLALEDPIFDSRIPLRSEEEFRVGITFIVKLVGCGTVSRPNSRMEIVSSMRSIRSDCRMRKDRKRKVVLTVSYEGVKVSLPPKGKKSNSNLIITQHPIHRIFYVSHDSLDLHIFSYIAREGSVFKCFVFKAAKQSLAVNIVRTIGQAFELCHKMAYIMNECTNISSSTTSETTNNREQLSHNGSIQASTTNENNQPRIRVHDENLQNDLNLNMEQVIHEVDCKLDRLNSKIEILEKQISVLLASMTIHQHHQYLQRQKPTNDHKPTGNSDSDSSNTAIRLSDSESSSDPTTFYKNDNPINKGNEPKCKTSSENPINSPDSLLSSPNQEIRGSCLLFKDLY